MKLYGQATPPEVDLKNITGKVPIAMFVGTADDLGDQEEVKREDSAEEGLYENKGIRDFIYNDPKKHFKPKKTEEDKLRDSL